MPLYEYECKSCGSRFEKLEKINSFPVEIKKALSNGGVYCSVCGRKTAYRIPSLFKIGSKVLETTGKSGYETDDFTLGKLIDEGGIPYEEKARLVDREKTINRQKEYTKGLKKRAKKYKFNPSGDD